MASLIGQDIGHYHLIEQLGQGGMATIYKAFDNRLERSVAIKIIRSTAFSPETLGEMLKRFEREAKALARLSHPNIVKIHDYGDFNGSPYLVMEYLPGGTLKQCYKTSLPWSEAVRILMPVARALAYAHSHNILHRDVKPSNILITESGEPMLSDFGIAKILDLGEGHTLTGTGVGIGTPEYMAPEQGVGSHVDARADVYALGVVLYELITGLRPFTADTPMAVILKHMSEPLPRPGQYVKDLPEQVEQVLFKAMAKRPDDRYENMMAFVAALDKLTAMAAVIDTQRRAADQDMPALPVQPLTDSRPASVFQVQPVSPPVSQPSIAPARTSTGPVGAGGASAGVVAPQSKPLIARQPVPEDVTHVLPRVKTKKSPWLWIGVGGIALIVILIVAVIMVANGVKKTMSAVATKSWGTMEAQGAQTGSGSQGITGSTPVIPTPPFTATAKLPEPIITAPPTVVAAVVPKMGLLRINTGYLPDTLDPQKASFTNEIAHLSMIYEGLTTFDENLQTIPGAAESWEYRYGGKQLIFTLKPGLRYSDGKVLNAVRFADAIKRSLDPETQSEYGPIMEEISGAADWLYSDPSAVGYSADKYISALGIKTFTPSGQVCKDYDQEDCLVLQLDFTRPAPYFHTALSLWVIYPVRIELIVAGGEDWWKNPLNLIGNGPFILKGMDFNNKSTFVPNPRYQGEKSLTEVEFYYVEDTALSYQKYLSNEFDMIIPGTEFTSEILGDAVLKNQYIQYPGSCTIVIKFALAAKVNGMPSPFQDKKVREAFAFAFDAEAWAQEVDGGTSNATWTWIPQGYPGYDAEFQPYRFDPVLARKALAESSYGGPDKLNAMGLTIQYSDSARNKERTEWLAANYLKNLGVEISVQPVDATTYNQLIRDPESFPLLSRQGWCADYPDPHNWMNVYWKSDSAFASRQGYKNLEFDQLVTEAATLTDYEKRLALYQEAQRLLLSDAPAAFGYNTSNRFLVKPWVKGYRLTPMDNVWPGQMVPVTVFIDASLVP